MGYEEASISRRVNTDPVYPADIFLSRKTGIASIIGSRREVRKAEKLFGIMRCRRPVATQGEIHKLDKKMNFNSDNKRGVKTKS